MKRLFIYGIMLVMAFSLIGCSKQEKREAILQYINCDSEELLILCQDMLASYNGVVLDKHFNSAVTYKEFNDNTVVLAKTALEEAYEVAELIDDEELANIHKILIEYLEGFVEVLDLAVKGIEQTSVDKINQVNEKVKVLNGKSQKYYEELKKMGEKYDVEIVFPTNN